MMKTDDAVFSSDIIKSGSESKNNLYDLLNVVPAKPLFFIKNHDAISNRNETSFSFNPDANKRYIPHKISKLKVKTVRDIRALYERDVTIELPDELEKQKNYLLKKIRYGFSTNEHTKNNARSMLNGEKPISTSAWQMLATINPYDHKYPKQFVLWNGRRIQVNGSRGGKTKFICNYDLKKNKSQVKKISNLTNSVFKKKGGLLRNSLNIKFKPGPLQKKKFLDDSHHKYHMGDVQLIPLPKPVLDIFPSYGAAVDSTIATFINSLREDSGLISPKLAEYAVSVLGTLTNNCPVQMDNKCCVTFDINFDHGQNRLLMRRSNVESTLNLPSYDNSYRNATSNSEISTMTEIQDIIEKIINTVEISLLQDDMYSVDDLTDTKMDQNQDKAVPLHTKDKSKKRCSELNRLDVTVIKIPEMCQKPDTEPCGKSFCTLGCICESLNCSFNLKQHCGVLDCMFGCKCDLSKFKDVDFLERDNPEIIQGLFKLENEINSRLSKEEQKFHQTVIVSGEKSILLKSRKRKCKTSPKYAEYCSNINLKSQDKINMIPVVKIEDIGISCKSVEPLCMVHNLYKCFCKGRFFESSYNVVAEKNNIVTDETKSDKLVIATDTNTNTEGMYLRPRNSEERKNNNKILHDTLKQNIVIDLASFNCDTGVSKCARTEGYGGRKYSDRYYRHTNARIKRFEENDELLKVRLQMLVNKSCTEPMSKPQRPKDTLESELEDMRLYYDENSDDSDSKTKSEEKVLNKTGPLLNSNRKFNLKAWIEVGYRMYKERRAQGLPSTVLKMPERGLSCMLPWEAILSRYRERKNVYFVSKQPPYRTFLGVNPNSPMFKTCVNLDDIRFADLPKYPPIVQNLITNANESNNLFCMLRGWDGCWELIGSAVKIVENGEKPDPPFLCETESSDWLDRDYDDWLTEETSSDATCSTFTQKGEVFKEKYNSSQERSKWFVMKIENDFNEIQFNTRGFFVTYDGIQRSIKLARLSGKTVRLSPQTRDKNCSTQFGIYAIPSTKDSCVFIGPYEENESLGIETVKTCVNNKKQEKTRGVWIITNKIDNLNVIDNPLSFMPSSTINEETPFETVANVTVLNDTKHQQVQQTTQEKESHKEPTKVIKPITIRRTNIIQNLPSKNVLITTNSINMKSPFSILKNNAIKRRLETENSSASTSVAYVKPFMETAKLLNDTAESVPSNTTTPRPVAEIAPQIKITHVYSEKTSPTNDQGGPNNIQGPTRMMVLKPDEINKRIGLAIEKSSDDSVKSENEETMSEDVEGFLENFSICACPEDILVISDCEEDNDTCKPVWIQCSNISEFGHFPGTKKGNMLSFKIPGFNYSEFYTQSEAFEKINQLLERKIYIPKFVTLKWAIVQSTTSVTSQLLTTSHLSDKKYLFTLLRAMRKLQGFTGARPIYIINPDNAAGPSTSTSSADTFSSPAETISLIDDLEETSKELEDNSTLLLNAAVAKQTEFGKSLSLPEDRQAEMTEKLQDIFNLNNE